MQEATRKPAIKTGIKEPNKQIRDLTDDSTKMEK